MSAQEVSKIVVDSALKVHSELGPGMLENAYKVCLAHELRKRGLRVETEVVLPLKYDSVTLDAGYRLDLLVEDLVIVEVKACEGIHPIHHAQIISYLKLSKKNLGLIFNFHAAHLREGMKRFVHGKGWSTKKPS
jgi:GxxExxY protein